jgi:hypothetical protein
MSEPWNYPDYEWKSSCCNAPPLAVVFDHLGNCSRCKEGAWFEREEEEDEAHN